MRPIRFRAWDGERMYFVAGIEWYNHTSDVVVGLRLAPLEGEEFVPTTKDPSEMALLQFTGLKDKNGKDIYEGDILKCREIWTLSIHETPIWHNVSVIFEHGKFKPFKENNFRLTFEDSEVIGNKFQNPELIS